MAQPWRGTVAAARPVGPRVAAERREPRAPPLRAMRSPLWAPTRATPRARAHVRLVAAAGADDSESAPAVRSHKVRWEEKYVELAAFVREHGHASVPPRDRWIDLNKWVVYQRKRRRQGIMSSEQETALDELGVCWEPRTPRPDRRGMEDRWREKFEELRSFVETNGHTRVPSGDTKLHRWLHEQRRSFAKGKLREPRRRRLEGLGVDLKSESRMSWEDRVEELKEFRSEHGHCNVPATWRHNPSLGGWVKHQRMQFRADKLNAERKRTLDALGFNWDPKKKDSRATGSRSFHVRENVSPWALVNAARSRGVGGDLAQEMDTVGKGARVSVMWMGEADEADEEEMEKEDGKVPVVGGWGRSSATYEEKQHFVFRHIEDWWKGDDECGEGWAEARGLVRDMRYNYAVQAKKRRIKPDIVIEMEQDGGTIWGLVIEVDEFAHRRGKHYSWRAEEKRMQELQTTLGVKLKIVRFNPDPTGSFPIGLEERTCMLLEHVVQSMQSAPVRDLEVEYFLYD